MFRIILVLLILITQSLQGQTDPSWLQLKDKPIRNVKQFGAKGNGTTDDTAAIQAAVNAGITYFPAGTYIVTSPINIPNRSGIAGFQQGTWSTDPTKNSIIKYNGATSLTTAVVAITSGTIGTAGTSVARSNIAVVNITIDCNAKAGYGIWADYLTNESRIENVTVIGATKVGIALEGPTYYNKFHRITVRNNTGVGLKVGTGANANQFLDIQAHTNGSSFVGDPYDNAGVIASCNSSNRFSGVTSESNKGPGLILNVRGAGNSFESMYFEGNNVDASVAESVGVYVDPVSGGTATSLSSVYLQGTPPASSLQRIFIAGSGSAAGIVINNLGHAAGDYSGVISDPNKRAIVSVTGANLYHNGNRTPKSVYAVSGAIHAGHKLMTRVTNGSTALTPDRWETHSGGLVDVISYATSPVQIATFSVIQPGSSRAVSACYDFTLGFNERLGLTRQCGSVASGKLMMFRHGLGGSSNTNRSIALIASQSWDTNAGNANGITVDELSTSIISGGLTETQIIGLYYTRKNTGVVGGGWTPADMSMCINGTLTNASSGTSKQGIAPIE